MLGLNSPGEAELSSGLRFWAGRGSGEPGPRMNGLGWPPLGLRKMRAEGVGLALFRTRTDPLGTPSLPTNHWPFRAH